MQPEFLRSHLGFRDLLAETTEALRRGGGGGVR